MDDNLAACMGMICDPEFSTNPVAWFDLEAAGFTRELLAEVANGPGWLGPKPIFENAPDRDSPIWLEMRARKATKDGET